MKSKSRSSSIDCDKENSKEFIILSDDISFKTDQEIIYHTFLDIKSKEKQDYFEINKKLYLMINLDHYGSMFIGNTVVKSNFLYVKLTFNFRA